MNINSISPVSFKGTWEKSVKPFKRDGYDQAQITESIYHPFKDEEIPANIKASTKEVRGISYLEYDENDDNFGNEDRCLNIETTKIGNKLDITEAEYQQLVATKKAGEEASKKIFVLGPTTKPEKMSSEKEQHGSTVQTLKHEHGSEEVSKILAGINYLV